MIPLKNNEETFSISIILSNYKFTLGIVFLYIKSSLIDGGLGEKKSQGTNC